MPSFKTRNIRQTVSFSWSELFPHAYMQTSILCLIHFIKCEISITWIIDKNKDHVHPNLYFDNLLNFFEKVLSEGHRNSLSGIVSTELTALSSNAFDRTEVQSVLITYTEPRVASPQPLPLDLQCGHERLPGMFPVSRVHSSWYRLSRLRRV